ncbi:MAG: archaeosortase/exosortase family protein, partial [Rubripirellula sp.]
AAMMFLKRSWIDNTVLALSIVPIALIVNAWRVVTVSLATQYAPQHADTVHDAAGLIMMLLAMAILWAVLKFLDALFSDPNADLRQNSKSNTKHADTSPT